MALPRKEIVSNLINLTDKERVIIDEQILKESSIDRFRKVEGYFDTWTQPLPAAVVYAESKEEIASIVSFANENKINIVARSGASATEGGLETIVKDTIVLDGSKMNKIINIDIENMLATCQSGVPLQVLDDKLREQGYTTGHSPQSKPLAQMGGLVATRSIGQFSTLYGGIEDMVVGLEAVFPGLGITKIKSVPRRAAGPDLRHLIIGNEGALCYITEVTVKIFKYYPENNKFYGYLLDDMKTGFKILREVMVAGYKPSIARLYDEEDGDYHFSHFANGKCVLIFMAEGPQYIAEATAKGIEEIVGSHPAKMVDSKLIETWFNNLNWDPNDLVEERRETIEMNNTCSTTEISANWDAIMDIYDVCMKRIRNEVPDVTMLGAHSSHSYLNGTNVYFVYFYNLDCKPEDEITKYHLPIKKIVVEETIKAGGSMCHHHGVGKHRSQWIDQEHGSAYKLLETMKKAYDPNGIMNVGTILPIKD